MARRAREADVLDDIVSYLRCPNCRASLTRLDGVLRCSAGHSFDIARQGYVSLLAPGTPGGGGDTAAMVGARREFLAGGHYAGIAGALADAAAASVANGPGGGTGRSPWLGGGPADELGGGPGGGLGAGPGGELGDGPGDGLGGGSGGGCVVDAGAGTGYYLAAVLEWLPRHAGLALDISRPALRVAARAHRRIGAVACDAWRPLPVADSAAELVLNVFAPRDGAELRRILRPDGRLLVVTPAADHLAELIGPLGLLTVDDRKQQRLADKLGPYFEVVGEREYRAVMSIDHAAVGALVAMGPSSWHAGTGTVADRIGRLPEPVPVTKAVRLAVLRPRH